MKNICPPPGGFEKKLLRLGYLPIALFYAFVRSENLDYTDQTLIFLFGTYSIRPHVGRPLSQIRVCSYDVLQKWHLNHADGFLPAKTRTSDEILEW